jgi:hypothetical protein
MKTNEMKKILLLAVGIIFMVSCAEDDNLPMIEKGNALSLRVIAENFTSGQSTPETRAAESGYTTTFTNGDRIGIIAINGTTIIEDNIPYQYNGTTWEPESSTIHAYPSPVAYVAYYPYSTTMNGKKSADEIITAFTPQTDQSTYAAYTASDLMTGTGTISNGELAVTLTHALSLVEVKLPQIKYTTGSIEFDGFRTIETLLIGGTQYYPMNLTSDGVYRCIVKPGNAIINGTYPAIDKTITFSQMANLSGGRYARLNVTHAGATDERAAARYKAGDFYPDPNVIYDPAQPGTVLSGSDAIGIVFWLDDTATGYEAATDNVPATGSHGKIVSLDEEQKSWGPDVFIGANSNVDALYNMKMIETYISTNVNGHVKSAFPAFEWVDNKNNSGTAYESNLKGVWYMPASNADSGQLSSFLRASQTNYDLFSNKINLVNGILIVNYNTDYIGYTCQENDTWGVVMTAIYPEAGGSTMKSNNKKIRAFYAF